LTNISDLFEQFSPNGKRKLLQDKFSATFLHLFLEKSANLNVAEIRRAAEETSVPEKSYRVAFLGGAQVGKTSIIDQGSNKM
jgi:hypothetical protein